MGCRIHYAVRDGMLQAVVSGRTSGTTARWIARDIAEQAGRETVKRVLIDLRGLGDRLGSLGALTMADGAGGAVRGYRVAVVDAPQNDAYYALHEMAAAARGCVMRCFSSVSDATGWLRRLPSTD